MSDQDDDIDKKPEEEEKPEEEDKKPEEDGVEVGIKTADDVSADLWESLKSFPGFEGKSKNVGIEKWQDLDPTYRKNFNVLKIWERRNKKCKENYPDLYEKIDGAVDILIDAWEERSQEIPTWQELKEERRNDILLRMHPKSIDEEKKRAEQIHENLLPEDQYTYDYAIVFRLIDKPEKKPEHDEEHFEHENKAYRKEMEAITRIIDYFMYADLKFVLYKTEKNEGMGDTYKKIICLLGASEARIRKEAARIEFDLLLNPKEIKRLGSTPEIEETFVLLKRVASNEKCDEDYTEDLFRCTYGIFKEFEKDDGKEDEDKLKIYTRYNETPFRSNSFFSELARLKITKAIVEAETAHQGGDLTLAAYARSKEHPAIAFFPMHEPADRKKLQKKFAECCSVMKDSCCCTREANDENPAPKNEVSFHHSKIHWALRNYFGEAVGLYFTFLSFYTVFLLPAAILGFIFYIPQIVNVAQNSGSFTPANFIMGILMVVWAVLLLESWKRVEASMGAYWGSTNFEDKETIRPEFEGEWEISTTTGEKEEVEKFFKHLARLLCSQTIVWSFIICVIGIVAALLIMKIVFVINYPDSHVSTLGPPIINALMIMVLNKLFAYVSEHLNDFENHRTDSEFEDSKIMKSFLFKFINSYNSLFIIAFLKRYIGSLGYCKGSYFLTWRKIRKFPTNKPDNLFTVLENETKFWRNGLEPTQGGSGLLTTFVGQPLLSKNPKAIIDKVGNSALQGSCDSWNYWKINFPSESQECGGGSIIKKPLCDEVCNVYEMLVDPTLTYIYKGDCFWELSLQLLILFATQIFVQNSMEVLIPFLTSKSKTKKMKEAGLNLTAPEVECFYSQYEGTFGDYDELVVQFGYVCLFVVAFPGAPLFAFLNNCLEFRVDGLKLTSMTRRPYPMGAYDIGTWYTMLSVISVISIASNTALMFLVPSNVIPDAEMSMEGRLLIFFIIEHFLIIIRFLVSNWVPDQPTWVVEHLIRQDLTTDILIGR